LPLHPKSKEDQKSAGDRSFDIDAKFRDFCGVLGLAPSDAGGKTTFVGEDPILPSRHRLGACISIPMMAAAVGAATIWRMRSGRGQDLQLDLRKAIHGINPMLKFMPSVNGYGYHIPYALGNPMKFDVYLTKDGRWFCPTGIYPHLLHAWCQFVEANSVSDVFIPQMIDLYTQGPFPFDQFISFYRFDEINKAVADLHHGKTIKAVLVTGSP
jgi:hypothetical protein